MESALGTLEKITDLRTIWKHEAQDFSLWLSQEENLSILSRAIGIDVVLEERESSVGDFNVDIFASEEGTNRKIIIENQLEDTNHDHLGKIITYASGKNAEVIIWIVKRARDEHKQAIEWLNQHTDNNIGFFLIEIELWKINNSLPAPKFNVVERPNDWAKTIKISEGLSDTQKLKLEYWQKFNEYADSDAVFSREFSIRKPQPCHWYDLSIGSSSYHIGLTVNTQKKRIGAEIYFSKSKDLYKKFMDKKDVIERWTGQEVQGIEAEQDCRIVVFRNGDIKETKHWENEIKWMFEMALKFKKAVKEIDI